MTKVYSVENLRDWHGMGKFEFSQMHDKILGFPELMHRLATG